MRHQHDFCFTDRSVFNWPHKEYHTSSALAWCFSIYHKFWGILSFTPRKEIKRFWIWKLLMREHSKRAVLETTCFEKGDLPSSSMHPFHFLDFQFLNAFKDDFQGVSLLLTNNELYFNFVGTKSWFGTVLLSPNSSDSNRISSKLICKGLYIHV